MICYFLLRGISFDIGSHLFVAFRTAIHHLELSSIDGQRKVAIDSTQTATGIQLGILIRGCGAGHGVALVAIGVGMVTRTEVGLDKIITAARRDIIVVFHCRTRCHLSLTVTLIEDISESTALDGDVDTAIADVGRNHHAVTATEELVETSAFDHANSAVGIGSVTAAEDLLDGILATIDVHTSSFLAAGRITLRSVVSLVATAQHIVDGIVAGVEVIVGGQVRNCMRRAIDVDGDIALRRTIEVVAAVDIAVVGRHDRVAIEVGTCLFRVDGEGGVTCIDNRGCIYCLIRTDIDRHRAMHQSLDVARGAIDTVFLSQTAAIDAAGDAAGEDIDDSGLTFSIHTVGDCAAVDIAESRTTIDVTVDGGACRNRIQKARRSIVSGRCCGEGADSDMHAAVDPRGLTVATTEDTMGLMLRVGTHGATDDRDRGVARHSAVSVAAAIDTSAHYAFVREGHTGVARDTGLVATTVDGIDLAAADTHHRATRVGGHIATTEDIGNKSAGNVDIHSALRGTIEVVAAENLIGSTTVDEDRHSTLDEGRDIARSAADTVFLA